MADGPGCVNRPAAGLLVYDGECELCRKTVMWIRRRDRTGQLELLPYQDPEARARFRGVPKEAFEGALQLLLPGGGPIRGARAVEEVLRLLPAGRVPGLLFSLPGARLLAGRVYGWVAPEPAAPGVFGTLPDRWRAGGGCRWLPAVSAL